jgi:plasmid stability protein
MAQLLIRNVAETVTERPRARARRHGKSMEQELRDIPGAAADADQLPKVEVGLGMHISSMFAGNGLDFEVEELRGQPVRPAEFEP